MLAGLRGEAMTVWEWEQSLKPIYPRSTQQRILESELPILVETAPVV